MFLVDWEYVQGSRAAGHNHSAGCASAEFTRGLGSPLSERWRDSDWYWPALWAALRPMGGDS